MQQGHPESSSLPKTVVALTAAKQMTVGELKAFHAVTSYLEKKRWWYPKGHSLPEGDIIKIEPGCERGMLEQEVTQRTRDFINVIKYGGSADSRKDQVLRERSGSEPRSTAPLLDRELISSKYKVIARSLMTNSRMSDGQEPNLGATPESKNKQTVEFLCRLGERAALVHLASLTLRLSQTYADSPAWIPGQKRRQFALPPTPLTAASYSVLQGLCDTAPKTSLANASLLPGALALKWNSKENTSDLHSCAIALSFRPPPTLSSNPSIPYRVWITESAGASAGAALQIQSSSPCCQERRS